LDLIDSFPEIDFDFNIVAAMGRKGHEIAAEGTTVFSR
jgi:hypothetical protein